MTDDYLGRILTSRVYDVAEETPLDQANNLSERLDNTLWLKREDEQPVFSFKLRGAYNCMSAMPRTALDAGVIASSAGNHAQGVALAAEKLGCRATIVMPITTPIIKINAVKARGAAVVLAGSNYDDAYAQALALQKEHGYTFIPPYNHPDIIAGNGTIGFEILKQHPNPLYAVFVPVGGGGLIAGISTYVKKIRPQVRIIGVEPDDADSMRQAMSHGTPVKLESVGQFADGVAVREVGAETYRLASQFVDEIITVSNDEMCAAIKDVFEDTRSIMEAAGALSVAGVKKYIANTGIRNENVIAILSGANMNFDRLRHVSERADIGERREAILAVTIPEKPGSFRAFCATIGERAITEFNYRYADNDRAQVYVGLKLGERKAITLLIEELRSAGYDTLDLTDNEMAKLHVRHMVGGLAPKNTDFDEIVYRFELPEHPRALITLLDSFGQNWNISMFHYRNHGADYGRVLVGLQVKRTEHESVDTFVRSMGYPSVNETDNPVYQLFLSQAG